MDNSELNKVMSDRRETLSRLLELGIDPFPYRFDKTHTLAEAHNLFSESKPDARPQARIAGRIISPLRLMGKAAFTHCQDETGRLQIYLKRDDLGQEVFQWAKKLDVGDIIGISGEIFQTRTGEIPSMPGT